MPVITVEQGSKIKGFIKEFEGRFNASFISILQHNIRSFQKTREINQVHENLDNLDEALHKKSTNGEFINLPDNVLPCLKRVLLTKRRDDATDIESAKLTTIHPEVINALEDTIKPLDEMINQQWLQEVEPMRVPKLSEYLSIQQIENHWRSSKENSVREYDEKFHILQAPGKFQRDLAHYRWECDLREASVVIAYLDIDDFKQFNEKYGHTTVDRYILPPFMRLLERHTYCHGYAYRYGGDEYALLLPNMEYELAIMFLNLLRRKAEGLQYQGVNERTTVSIGYCYLDSDSYLTNHEGEERANRAMRFAKHSGKNCVASFLKSRFDDASLQIVCSSQASGTSR